MTSNLERKKVLVVDDDEQFLRITKLNLEDTKKYDVMTLVGAENIISCVHNFKPDVILLDILMPEIGGIEVCKMLNNDPVGAGVPIIVVSALDTYEGIREAYKAGAVDYLAKPVGKAELVAKIEKYLRYKEQSV